jgi:hypothetical protein
VSSETRLVFYEEGLICSDVRFASLEESLMSSQTRLVSSEGGLVFPETELMSSETNLGRFLTICWWFKNAEGDLECSFDRWKFFEIL